jgi:predicted Zn-dependent protease with MMP-like domain
MPPVFIDSALSSRIMTGSPNDILGGIPPRAPSLEDIETLAGDAFQAIPEEFRALVGDVVIRVEDFPDAETEAEMELESPFDILGLYRGVSLAHKGVMDQPSQMDMIFLYRRPLLDYWCETGEALDHVVRHVLIHEIGHHFGLSDDDMERIERQADADTAG